MQITAELGKLNKELQEHLKRKPRFDDSYTYKWQGNDIEPEVNPKSRMRAWRNKLNVIASAIFDLQREPQPKKVEPSNIKRSQSIATLADIDNEISELIKVKKLAELADKLEIEKQITAMHKQREEFAKQLTKGLSPTFEHKSTHKAVDTTQIADRIGYYR